MRSIENTHIGNLRAFLISEEHFDTARRIIRPQDHSGNLGALSSGDHLHNRVIGEQRIEIFSGIALLSRPVASDPISRTFRCGRLRRLFCNRGRGLRRDRFRHVGFDLHGIVAGRQHRNSSQQCCSARNHLKSPPNINRASHCPIAGASQIHRARGTATPCLSLRPRLIAAAKE